MRLRAFAPLVEGLVARVAISGREGAASAAIRALQARGHDLEPGALDLQSGEALLGLGEPGECSSRAERCAFPVGGGNRLAQSFGQSLTPKKSRAFELVDGFQKHMPVARTGQT